MALFRTNTGHDELRATRTPGKFHARYRNGVRRLVAECDWSAVLMALPGAAKTNEKPKNS